VAFNNPPTPWRAAKFEIGSNPCAPHLLHFKASPPPLCAWRSCRRVRVPCSPAGLVGRSFMLSAYPPACDVIAFWSCAFTASMLKLAPFCIGGNSIKVWAALATSC
jgi:hypothetical protein